MVLFVTIFAFRDADRARLVNVTCVDRDNRRCAQENIFDTVVAGAAAEGVSPEIDVRRMMWLCSKQEHTALTGMDKDTMGIWCAVYYCVLDTLSLRS